MSTYPPQSFYESSALFETYDRGCASFGERQITGSLSIDVSDWSTEIRSSFSRESRDVKIERQGYQI